METASFIFTSLAAFAAAIATIVTMCQTIISKKASKSQLIMKILETRYSKKMSDAKKELSSRMKEWKVKE